MASVTLATSEWIGFFKDAGIPAGPAVNYAVTFVDNRIQKNMLMDLNKEIMNELGITAVGDVIAILKHAKVVHRQDICKALIDPPSPTQNTMQAELRRSANSRNCTATRMIANSLSRDSPPSTPVRRSDTSASKISVTVSNKVALKNAQAASTSKPCNLSEVPVKRRRVTAEMEGKYIINMPKGTTAKTKKILEDQASIGFGRTSVFDRLGAENKADTTTGNKPTGVFSRLGDAHEDDKSTESDEEGYVLPYEGVLKKRTTPQERPALGVTVKAKATSSENKKAVTTLRRLTSKPPASAPAKLSTAKISIAQRLGKVTEPEDERARKAPSAALAKRLGKPQIAAQDSKVTSTKPPTGGFKVTIKRTLGSPKVSSSSDSTARMDNTRNVSVFKRLGRKSL